MSDNQSDNWDTWGPKKAMTNDDLPPLPKSEATTWHPFQYTADQMRAAQREAYEAGKRRAAPTLTDEEIVALGRDAFGIDPALDGNLMRFARAIEAALAAKR